MVTCNDRQETYGDAGILHEAVAEMWAALDRISPNPNTSSHVLLKMSALKMARAAINPKHQDNYTDGCGYFGLAGETATEEEKPSNVTQLHTA